MIEFDHPQLSLRRQCDLIGLHRGIFYYKPAEETPLNLALMRQIDEEYTRHPFYGSPKMTTYLQQQGYAINHKRVERLMKKMGLRAHCPSPQTRQPRQAHKIYPYLLRGLTINYPLQVFSSDITYILMQQGFMYLVAVLDWFSRYVVSWQLSNTLDPDFCLHALHQALQVGTPEIFNTDQGAQFTSLAFTGCLEDADIRVSMDGRGRCFDNIFVERLWRSVKYEEIYLQEYPTVATLERGLEAYVLFYNHERPHQSLENRVPVEVFSHA